MIFAFHNYVVLLFVFDPVNEKKLFDVFLLL